MFYMLSDFWAKQRSSDFYDSIHANTTGHEVNECTHISWVETEDTLRAGNLCVACTHSVASLYCNTWIHRHTDIQMHSCMRSNITHTLHTFPPHTHHTKHKHTTHTHTHTHTHTPHTHTHTTQVSVVRDHLKHTMASNHSPYRSMSMHLHGSTQQCDCTVITCTTPNNILLT